MAGALGWILLSFSLAQGAADVKERPARLIPNTDINPYGANFFLEREVEDWKREKTLQLAKEAGLGWVKQHFPWEEIEPVQKGDFRTPATRQSSWLKFDRIVELCQKHGLQIVARLDRPPDWTRQDNTYKERPPDNFDDYGDFVYEFVKHYKGRIQYIQIWNEPNIFPEWGNRPVDPVGYTELLKVAYRRAKEADPDVYILSAPLAPTLGQAHPEPGRWISMNDLDFLEAMYQAGAKDYFDILSVNAFGMDRPPDDPPDPQVLNFSRVVLQREIMEKYGDHNKPVWFNEYGWNASPATFPEEKLTWKRVDETEQASFIVQGIDMARREWLWAGMFAIWYFRQVGNIPPARPDYYFRMVDVDFTPRLAYRAVQRATAAQEVARPGIYQETNPALAAKRGWHLTIAEQASAQAHLVSTTPGDRLTITFRGDNLDLIALRDQESGRLEATLDGHPVPGLIRSTDGKTYVNLYSPKVEWQARLPIVRRAGNGEHTLQLTVAGTRDAASLGYRVAIDGFVVTMGPTPNFPYLATVMLGLGMLTSSWLIYREWRQRPTEGEESS
ncbi:MAG: hypothetical protein ACE5NP_06840 [Anaerolineae bacterium]